MKKPNLTKTVEIKPTTESKGEVELDKKEDPRDKVSIKQDGWGPGLGQNLDTGDTLTYTYAAETFTPVSFNSFTVGPFSTTVTVREGEGLEDVYLRAAKFLRQIFEAEFLIKRKEFFQRLKECTDKN